MIQLSVGSESFQEQAQSTTAKRPQDNKGHEVVNRLASVDTGTATSSVEEGVDGRPRDIGALQIECWRGSQSFIFYVSYE